MLRHALVYLMCIVTLTIQPIRNKLLTFAD
jgi:hypothetical protein